MDWKEIWGVDPFSGTHRQKLGEVVEDQAVIVCDEGSQTYYTVLEDGRWAHYPDLHTAKASAEQPETHQWHSGDRGDTPPPDVTDQLVEVLNLYLDHLDQKSCISE